MGFQNFCFPIAYFCGGIFCQPAYKSIEKHKCFRLIAPKQKKIDMPCRNKKSLDLGAFSDTSVSFPIKTKIFSFGGLFTNSKQRYMRASFKEKRLFMALDGVKA